MSCTFTHIGMNNFIQNERVLVVLKVGTATTQRVIEHAKKTKKYLDCSWGRHFKTVILLDDGTVLISCIKPKTLMNRLNGGLKNAAVNDDENEDNEEEEEVIEEVIENEDYQPDGEDTMALG